MLENRLLETRITNLYKGPLVGGLVTGLVIRANIEKEPEGELRKAS